MFIDIKARRALKKLNRLEQRMRNTRPLMRDIAGVMADAVEENFAREGRPKWVDLQPATKKARARKNKWPGKILQVSGKLASSVSQRSSQTEAAVGSNLVYAGVHQFGSTKQNIPARPFLRMQDDDIDEILDLVNDWVGI